MNGVHSTPAGVLSRKHGIFGWAHDAQKHLMDLLFVSIIHEIYINGGNDMCPGLGMIEAIMPSHAEWCKLRGSNGIAECLEINSIILTICHDQKPITSSIDDHTTTTERYQQSFSRSLNQRTSLLAATPSVICISIRTVFKRDEERKKTETDCTLPKPHKLCKLNTSARHRFRLPPALPN